MLVIGVVGSLLAETVALVDNQNQAIRKVPTTHKVVALTIDDGPHYKTTPEVLKVLKEKQAKVTFFVLGANAETYPEIIAQAAADGHEIGSHAYSHRFLNKMSPDAILDELERTEAIITNAGVARPSLIRPPGGGYNDQIVALLRQRGYTTILWSVDPGDWRRLSVEQIVRTTLEQVQPGSIVLLHDGQYPLPTPQAIGSIIDNLRNQGYQLVTVSELLQYYEESQ